VDDRLASAKYRHSVMDRSELIDFAAWSKKNASSDDVNLQAWVVFGRATSDDATDAGTLTLRVVAKGKQPLKLTVSEGSTAYTG
jgi:hypothetical protein